MFFKRLTNGILASNCYILGQNGEGVVIDPGAESDEIVKILNEAGLELKYIFLTHAHIDHILSMDKLREKTEAKVLVHTDDNSLLGDAWSNGSSLFGLNNTFKCGDILLKDGDIIKAGGMEFEIIHTPGHTPGGICIKLGDKLFSGDTLFQMSVGRTDLGKGDPDKLMDSLKNKLLKLDDNTTVYPGHGTATTIGYERENNPFIY